MRSRPTKVEAEAFDVELGPILGHVAGEASRTGAEDGPTLHDSESRLAVFLAKVECRLRAQARHQTHSEEGHQQEHSAEHDHEG